MGQTTHVAYQKLQDHLSSRGKMCASVAIKDPGGHRIFHNNIIRDDLFAHFAGGAHIEQVLMGKIYDGFNTFDGLPQGGTIVFASYWSPCTQCCEATIPVFANNPTIRDKGITIKFRFQNYYSKTDWTYSNSPTLWQDNATAQAGYAALSARFPSTNNLVAYHRTNEEEFFTFKVKPRLVIAPLSQARTSYEERDVHPVMPLA